jgi:hypothetical protein
VVYSNVVYCPNFLVGWMSGVRRCRLCVQCEGCCLSNNVVVGWRSGVQRCRLCVQCEGCCSSNNVVVCWRSGVQRCRLCARCEGCCSSNNVVVGWRSGVQRCRLCAQCEGCCSSNIPHTEHIVYAATPRTSNLLQHSDNTPHCCNHSLILLKMGKRLPETC